MHPLECNLSRILNSDISGIVGKHRQKSTFGILSILQMLLLKTTKGTKPEDKANPKDCQLEVGTLSSKDFPL